MKKVKAKNKTRIMRIISKKLVLYTLLFTLSLTFFFALPGLAKEDKSNLYPEMAYIPAGYVEMGSNDEEIDRAMEMFKDAEGVEPVRNWFDDEVPKHKIWVNDFYLDKYEVTNREYMKFVNAGGYVKSIFWSKDGQEWLSEKKIRIPECFDDFRFNDPDHPVVCISWYEASAYAKWAGKRLPTESEWERAARGDSNSIFPWGDNTSVKDGYRANYHPGGENQNKDGYRFTAPVQAFSNGVSPLGIFQMAGNVWEWCEDWYGEDYYAKSPAKNPAGPRNGTEKIVRGGSWLNSIISIRSSYRSYVDPKLRYSHIGLRCARSP
jgi:formylglycine-generating enzyme required for sulfatase activity